MGEHLINTPACWQDCRACGVAVLAALDGGAPVRVDPVALRSITEELAIQLGGRQTFDVVRIAGKIELIHRDQYRIQHRNYPILPEHRCSAQGLAVTGIHDPAQIAKNRRGAKPPAKKKTPPPASHDPPPF